MSVAVGCCWLLLVVAGYCWLLLVVVGLLLVVVSRYWLFLVAVLVRLSSFFGFARVLVGPILRWLGGSCFFNF